MIIDDTDDVRVRSIPLRLKRVNYEEVLRVYEVLSECRPVMGDG